MSKRVALDTNILIYCHDNQDVRKSGLALDLLDLSPVVPSQVATEYLNVISRLFKLSKQEALDVCLCNLDGCEIQPMGFSTLRLAKELVGHYDFQLFDSIVVALAVEAGCQILYSEDMQHGLVVQKQLSIVNPFICPR